MNLALEAALLLGAHGVVLRAQSELVAVLASDAVHLRPIFSAASNWFSGMSQDQPSGWKNPGPFWTLAPSPT